MCARVKFCYSGNMKVATHSGRFHADDIFAIATLRLVGIVDELIRTRDEAVLATCDMRVDVGRKNNPETGDYDHHQPKGAGERENGIQYAAFGLVWKVYGEQLCGTPEIAANIDRKLVQVVDADDTGRDLFFSELPNVRPYGVERAVMQYNPSWKSDTTPEEMDELFNKAVGRAMEILQLEITLTKDAFEATDVVRAAIKESNNGPLIIMEKFAPWKDLVQKEADEALFVLFPAWPARNGEWVVQAVPASGESFVNRKNFPEDWGGKEGAELVAASGVADAQFCHSALFLATAKNKAGAMELAEKALQGV